MNKVNVQHALNIMKRAKSVYMPEWQCVLDTDDVLETEAELHACGTAACFAGHVAVSPEFKADGGSVGGIGDPHIGGNLGGQEAIAEWLGIPTDQASALCYTHKELGEELYNKQSEEVTKEDVILVLEEMLGEEE